MGVPLKDKLLRQKSAIWSVFPWKSESALQLDKTTGVEAVWSLIIIIIIIATRYLCYNFPDIHRSLPMAYRRKDSSRTTVATSFSDGFVL
jgi:hypothetical protein